MTFAHRIKQEIISNKMSHNQAMQLIIGVCYSIGYLKEDTYFLKIKNSVIADAITNILKKININSKHNLEKNEWISFEKKEFPELKIPTKYISQFAGGLFLGGGSISDSSSSSYHLEIRINDSEKVRETIDFFKKHRFLFNEIQRGSYTIIYIKKSDQISDFLRAIGSYGGVMEFEEFRISRDFKNNINRIANLEVHNQNRIAKSSMEQVEIFLKLKERKIYKTLSLKNRRLIDLRIENQFVSLSELSDIYNEKYRTKTTKSELNNWINKLKKI